MSTINIGLVPCYPICHVEYQVPVRSIYYTRTRCVASCLTIIVGAPRYLVYTRLGLRQNPPAGMPFVSVPSVSVPTGLSRHSHQLQLRLHKKKDQTENSARMHSIEGNNNYLFLVESKEPKSKTLGNHDNSTNTSNSPCRLKACSKHALDGCG